MRLLLCLNNDFISTYALNLLWEHIRHHEIAILLSQGIGSPSTPKAKLLTQWGEYEKQVMNGPLHSLRTFHQLAESVKATLTSANINRPETLAHVQALAPDVILSIRYGHIFKPPSFDIPRYGVLNLHGGLLPAYRGILATFWAMLNREPDIGCALHYVRDTGIDTGEIIAQHHLPADYSRSVLWNIAQLYRGGTEMIVQALASIERAGICATMPQSTEGAGYYSYPLDEDMARFERQGGVLYEERDCHDLLKLHKKEELYY